MRIWRTTAILVATFLIVSSLDAQEAQSGEETTDEKSDGIGDGPYEYGGPNVDPTSPKLDLKRPEGAIELRYKFDEPVSYIIRGTSRMAIKDRPFLKQRYASTHRVSYEPFTDEDGQRRVEVVVAQADNEFIEPKIFDQPQTKRQILEHASISYVISPRGEISELEIGSKTSPLARASIEQMERLVTRMQAVLPERPVKPGDAWTQSIEYDDNEGVAQFSEDTVNRYQLESWKQCRKSMCAYITIAQDMKSAGQLSFQGSMTQGASVGTGSGWILFDYEAGQVVRSEWKLRGQGTVKAKHPQKDVPDAEVVVEVEASADRIEGLPKATPTLP